jgi:hypothetical protein
MQSAVIMEEARRNRAIQKISFYGDDAIPHDTRIHNRKRAGCREKGMPDLGTKTMAADTGVQSISTASPQPRQRFAPRKRAIPHWGQ